MVWIKVNLLLVLGSLLPLLSCTGGSDLLWLDADVPLDGMPAYTYRILDHWDNLDDTVERGYAGPSIWGWTEEALPVSRSEERRGGTEC